MRAPHPEIDLSTRLSRAVGLGLALLAASAASVLMADAVSQTGLTGWNVVRIGLIFLTTAWLAWGASLAAVGLMRRTDTAPMPAMQHPQPPTVILVPICNEDPVATFARIAAMYRSVRQAGVAADIAVLSDTRDAVAAMRERLVFARLLADTGGEGHVFYRQRSDNHGRKAGNIKDFIRSSGGAYELAVILDADSLVEGATIRTLIARMQANPRLGLLQTLPRIVGARSFFGRAMQFSAGFHGPVFTRGLARMQGATGPFWGHNAIIRMRAFAESCGLPDLTGTPPFGGQILSHDYVEAALLARAGWTVEVDHRIGGSFEEGPENLLSYARRDRRWCQGNLQHSRLLFAPGLRGWSRFVFLQGIFSYLVSLLWAAFLIVSVAVTVTAPLPDYFPEPHLLFPVFPSDRSKEIIALALGILVLLVLPKFAILAEAAATGRAGGFGGGARALGSVMAEILFTSLLAPLMLMYQVRAVLLVLSGQDGGWPANARGEGALGFAQSLRASLWIVLTGAGVLAVTVPLAPDLVVWLLPVCVPMLVAPLLIAWSSRPVTKAVFRTPEEQAPPPVVVDYRATLSRWTAPPPSAAAIGLSANAPA